MKRLATLISILALSGCNTIENQYVDATGKHGSGQTTFSATLSDGKFSIAEKSGSCSGQFDSWSNATVVFPVTCTNGKSGSVVMTRPTANASIIAGEGTIQFVGGETRRFVFGPKRFQ
jgi:hypothetical protein